MQHALRCHVARWRFRPPRRSTVRPRRRRRPKTRNAANTDSRHRRPKPTSPRLRMRLPMRTRRRRGQAARRREPIVATDAQKSICLLLESAARAHGLPVEFFARVIWQESRFRADAVGPVTRSGKRAQGIAQFMPGTAAERQPAQSVRPDPGAAEIGGVSERACAASSAISGLRPRPTTPARGGCANGSPARAACRPRPATMWRRSPGFGRAMGQGRGDRRPRSQHPGPGCGELMAMLKRAPNPFMAALEQRVILGAMQPWGVILGADSSRDRMLVVCRTAAPARRCAGRARPDPVRPPARSRCRAIRCGSVPTRAPPPTSSATASTRAAATAWCCAIRGGDGRRYFSAAALSLARPASNSPPTILSMSNTTWMTFATKVRRRSSSR